LNTTTKLHRPVIEEIFTALTQIFGIGPEGSRAYHSDKVLERIFKNNRKLGGRDRRLIAEGTYEIVRWWRLLWEGLGADYRSADAAGTWRVIGAWLLLNNYPLPDWREFSGLKLAQIREMQTQAAENNPAVRESFPDWLYERGLREIGSRWTQVAHALNNTAPVMLRANRLKIDRENLKLALAREDIHCDDVPETQDGLVLRERKNVFATESFKSGFFEVQDGASQQAAPLLNVSPGDRVIDGCAGAGGKTLHLAALMKNKGKIIAMDIYQKKLDELRRRCTRAGVDIVETKIIDSNKAVKRLSKSADRVLLDVPCTGLGVLRRNPDSKWKLTLEELTRLEKIQAEILSDYSEMLKVGGRLVYATCSILPCENREQIDRFINAQAGAWQLLEDKTYWPDATNFDGFYTAALERLR